LPVKLFENECCTTDLEIRQVREATDFQIRRTGSRQKLTAEKLVAQTNVTPGECGRGRLGVENCFANNGAEVAPKHRHLAQPKRTVESFFKGFVHHELGFQLENLSGLLHAAVVGLYAAAVGILFAASVGWQRFGLGAAIVVVSSFGCASVFGFEKRDGRRALAVAIDLLHTDANGSGQQCGYPKPSERFFCAGRH